MKNEFLKYCSHNQFQHNEEQIKALDSIINFYRYSSPFKNKFFNFFRKTGKKLGFYLHGDVGVGKTMLINFFFDQLKIPKKRMHFSEFMINFHDFRYNYKKNNNSIEAFVKNLKEKTDLILFMYSEHC